MALALGLGALTMLTPAQTALAEQTPGPPLPVVRAVPDLANGGRLLDSLGRQVFLRGVNDNAFGEYYQNNRFPPTFPFESIDPTIMRDVGWNVVRLVISWSRVEPEPGRYDDGYLDRVAGVVAALARQGVYTIVDMHQDAWGPAVVAAPGAVCPPPMKPNRGWDGAPAWATLGNVAPHCYTVQREDSPAVALSWQAFFADAPGPGGVGIQTRFVSMWAHVAGRFARSDAVVAFDLLNEPEAGGPPDDARLSALYGRTFAAIRAAEQANGGHPHIVMVEPSIIYSESGVDTPLPFPNDGNVAYAPHIYTGTFPTTTPPQEYWFQTAGAEAKLLGGAPVINGEWGGRPRSRDPIDTSYYNAYQAFLDKYGYSAAYWVFKSSCGDPFEIDQNATHAGGLYDVDCRTNQVIGIRPVLQQVLARPYPRAVNGTGTTFSYDPSVRRFTLSYTSSSGSAPTEISVPAAQFHGRYAVSVTGGQVVSAPGSDILKVSSCAPGQPVTVVVSAGSGIRQSGCDRATAHAPAAAPAPGAGTPDADEAAVRGAAATLADTGLPVLVPALGALLMLVAGWALRLRRLRS